MPRKAKDPRQKELEQTIGGIVITMGRKELARRSGIEYSTLCRRLKNIRSLTIGELWAIEDAGGQK